MENNNLLVLKKKAEDKYKKDRENFLQMRAVQENSVNDFIKKLLKLPKDIRDRLNIDENTNYKAFFPSLFQEPIDEIQYDIEMQKYRTFENKVKSIENELNAQAKKVLESYVG